MRSCLFADTLLTFLVGTASIVAFTAVLVIAADIHTLISAIRRTIYHLRHKYIRITSRSERSRTKCRCAIEKIGEVGVATAVQGYAAATIIARVASANRPEPANILMHTSLTFADTKHRLLR
jgi:hypothetical protein